METNPLEVIDFSHGITDFYIDGTPQAGQNFDNFFIDSNRKIFTRWGSEVVNDQLPLGLFRINKLAALGDDFIAFQYKRGYFDDGGTWTEIVGPLLGPLLKAGDQNSVITDSEWRGHLFISSEDFSSVQKVYKDSNGDWQVRNAGLPYISSGYSITNPPGAGFTYLYAIVLKFSYTVGTLTFTDRSTPHYYATTITGGEIGLNTAIINLPTTYPSSENWDTANWKFEIYRTANNGTEFYYVNEVPFGTGSYNDNNTDNTISTNEVLYTTGDVAANDKPPLCKYVHCVNNYGYYAHVKSGTEIEPTLLLQSKFSDPDSVPSSFFVNTEQPIRGLSSIFDRVIVFCDEYIYRIDNYFTDDGDGGIFLRRIDDKAGCISANSIVRTHLGIFWAGVQGFYWSDGFQVALISEHLPNTYKKITRNATAKKNIVGTYEPVSQRVFWTVSKDEGAGEGDSIYVLDLKFPFTPSGEKRGGTFTTMSGGNTPSNFQPTQVLRVGNYVYRGDARGYLFRHREDKYTDPRVDINTASNTWEISTIIHRYASSFLDFGTKFYRKFVPRILISAANTTNLSLAISSSNDNNRVVGELKPIRYTSNIVWGDPLPLWGDADALWNRQGLIEEWRRFPAGGLRCNYKQVIFTNAKSILFTSALLGTVNVDAINKTATLGGSFQFPEDIVDYFIKFENDGYTREFRIAQATATTIVYEDSLDQGPSVSALYNFTIVGYPKREVLYLNGYVIHWALISKSHTPFSSSSLGSNPT
jgi:hypothetical protein